jgi:hypothetical protein
VNGEVRMSEFPVRFRVTRVFIKGGVIDGDDVMEEEEEEARGLRNKGRRENDLDEKEVILVGCCGLLSRVE